MSGLEIISANMALDSGDARRRYEGFNELILGRESSPHIVVLQEVAWHPGEASLGALCGRLGPEYNMKTCPVYPGKADKKGSAIISRYPIVDHQRIETAIGGKSIQLATIEIPGSPLLQVANVHMEASPLKEVVRLKKVKQLIDLLSENPEIAQLIIGDLNAERFFPSVRRISKLGMSSVFDTLDMESTPTYPTPLSGRQLVDHGYSKSHQFQFMKALGQFITGKISSDSGLRKSVVDYIFHNGLVSPISAEVMAELHDGEILSDHRFLSALVHLDHKAQIIDYGTSDCNELPEPDTVAQPA